MWAGDILSGSRLIGSHEGLMTGSDGFDIAICIECGCDDAHACSEGCWWFPISMGIHTVLKSLKRTEEKEELFMSDKTGIAWTDMTWNPVTGCTKVSEGCRHCYAERVWPRLTASPGRYFGREFADVAVHSETLEIPLRKKRPRRIFVNSMSDLFHESVPDDFIDQVFAVMVMAKQHTFQILTKRPERMKAYMDLAYDKRVHAIETRMLKKSKEYETIDLPLSNVWLGVSVENQKTLNERIPILLSTPAAFRWVSIEPMIGPVNFRWASWHKTYEIDPETGNESMNHLDGLRRLDWVVVGGESGSEARPMEEGWVRILIEQCREAAVPFFLKQLGSSFRNPAEWKAGSPLKMGPSDRNGADPEEWAEDLRVREIPKIISINASCEAKERIVR